MISLVVTSRDRTVEPERFLAGVAKQTHKDFEVILVDQNPGGRLQAAVDRYSNLPIRYIHAPHEKGASRGRNAGLTLATGDIIGFPDDDAWYESDLLESVANWMSAHSEFDILCTILREASGESIGHRWPSAACECGRHNIWNTGLAATVFMRHKVCDAVGEFDTNIGVGAATKFQSGEETDYLLRAFNLGFRMWFEPSISVYHSDLQPIDRLRWKAYPYALGTGYILRAHGYGIVALGEMVTRSLGGAVKYACMGNLSRTQVYLARGAGEVIGYFGCGDLLRASTIQRDGTGAGTR